jgi:hypothetical protein
MPMMRPTKPSQAHKYEQDPETSKEPRTSHPYIAQDAFLLYRAALVASSSLVFGPHPFPSSQPHHGGCCPFRWPNGLRHVVWHGHYNVSGPGSLAIPRPRQGKLVRISTQLFPHLQGPVRCATCQVFRFFLSHPPFLQPHPLLPHPCRMALTPPCGTRLASTLSP